MEFKAKEGRVAFKLENFLKLSGLGRRGNKCIRTSVFLAGVERSASGKGLHCKISAPGGTGEFMERFIIQHMYVY
jgi:hypothetical protein